MRVLFCGMGWFPEGGGGGLNRYFYENVREAAALGTTGVALVVAREPAPTGGVDVRPFAQPGASLFHRWRGVQSLARKVLRNGVDLANTHFALYAYPWLHDLPGNVPLVVNFQGPWADEMVVQSNGMLRRVRAFFARRIETAVYARADRIITLSSAFADLVHQRYRIPSNRVRVIPAGLDLTPYLAAPERAEARARLGWENNRFILLTVRRLVARMGLDRLIDAIASVRKSFPNVLLLIGGEGPEEGALRGQIIEKGLTDHARLLGYIPESELPLAYAAADLSVVPTVALEGFGLITVESLAAGTAVLGTPVGATPEILIPLNPNLVFLSASSENMGEQIERVLRGQLTIPSRENCRAYAKRYQWSSIMPQVETVYREAIESRQGK